MIKIIDNIYYKEIIADEDINLILNNINKSIIHLTQTDYYYNWQMCINRKGKRFVFYKRDGGMERVVCYVSLFQYNLYKKYNYYYAPIGPVIWEYSPELMMSINNLCQELNKERDIVFTRIDISGNYNDNDNKNSKIFIEKNWVEISEILCHSQAVQPRAESVIDLSGDIEEIYNNFNKTLRYEIRKYEKRNTTSLIVTDNILEYFDDFMNIINETTNRNNFNFHNRDYVYTIFTNLQKSRNGFLSISYLDDIIIGIGVFVIYNNNSYYLFAGSKSDYNQYSPGYSVIYNAIKYIKDNNLASSLSLGAISTDRHTNNNLIALTSFKMSWSKGIIEHNYIYDIIGNKYLYYLYKMYKIIRGWGR